MGSASSRHATVRPVLLRATRPASDRTSRCFIIAGKDTGNGAASSLIERPGSCASRITSARRVGSERAAKVRSSAGPLHLTIWLSVAGTALLSIGDRRIEREEKGSAKALPKSPQVQETRCLAGLPDLCRLFHGARPIPEGRVQLRSYTENDSNDCDRNSGHEQPLFDGGLGSHQLFKTALTSFTPSSLDHSAGPAMSPISQPWRSTIRVVGMPKALPAVLRSSNTCALWSE